MYRKFTFLIAFKATCRNSGVFWTHPGFVRLHQCAQHFQLAATGVPRLESRSTNVETSFSAARYHAWGPLYYLKTNDPRRDLVAGYSDHPQVSQCVGQRVVGFEFEQGRIVRQHKLQKHPLFGRYAGLQQQAGFGFVHSAYRAVCPSASSAARGDKICSVPKGCRHSKSSSPVTSQVASAINAAWINLSSATSRL